VNAQRPSPTTPGAFLCPRCGNTLRDDQAWCMECGLAARTRVDRPPNWKLPIAATLIALLLAAAAIAYTLVVLFDEKEVPATPATVTTTLPPAAPAPAPVTPPPADPVTPTTTSTTPGAVVPGTPTDPTATTATTPTTPAPPPGSAAPPNAPAVPGADDTAP